MNQKRTAADRVRPILEAMESSIEEARRRRELRNGHTGPAAPQLQGTPANGRDAIHLKARPKRPSISVLP